MAKNESTKEQRLGGTGWFSRQRVLTLTLVLATLAGFYIGYLITRPFLPALAWALALAVAAHPLHQWFVDKLSHEHLAAGLGVAVVAVVVIVPTIFVTDQIIREGVQGLRVIEQEAASGRWRTAVERNPRLAFVLQWIESRVNLREEADGITKAIAPRVSSLVVWSAWTALQLLVTLFALFYFFRDRHVAMRTFRRMAPLSNTETEEVFSRVHDTIYATVYGTLAVAIIQGVLGGLMFWWLALPAPLLWGTAMAILATIPVLGAFVVWLPAALFLLLEGHVVKALILTIWGLVVVSLIDNLLYPVIVGKRMRLHTLPVFIAIIGGLVVFGASGLILGPVALAVNLALVDVWRRRTTAGHTAEEGMNE